MFGFGLIMFITTVFVRYSYVIFMLTLDRETYPKYKINYTEMATAGTVMYIVKSALVALFQTDPAKVLAPREKTDEYQPAENQFANQGNSHYVNAPFGANSNYYPSNESYGEPPSIHRSADYENNVKYVQSTNRYGSGQRRY